MRAGRYIEPPSSSTFSISSGRRRHLPLRTGCWVPNLAVLPAKSRIPRGTHRVFAPHAFERHELEDSGGDALGSFELDVMTDAGDELEHRAGNGGCEPLGRGRRHNLALGAGHHAGDAANVGEERERIDRLRVEHAPVPAESPPRGVHKYDLPANRCLSRP